MHHQNPPDRPQARRLRWIAAAAVTAAAAIAASTTVANAQTDTQQPVDVAVASYAADYGVSHTEARKRLARIDPLQELMESIRETEAERLAGWGIDHQGRFTAWVQLVGSVDSADDTFAAATERASQLLAQVLTGNYTIEDGSDFGAATDFMGGQELAGATGGEEASWCTSGFTAKQRGTGAYGIITAAHCVETYSSSIAMTSVRPGILLSSGPRRHGPDVDAMFRLIPTGRGHRALDDHLCDEAAPCDVSHTVSRSRMMSAPVCHYGDGTGHTCGIVIDINFDPGASNDSCAADCSNTFVRVTGSRVKLCEGDSGGPVHYDSTAGNKAYGIVSGGNDTNDCVSTGKWFYFSPIESVEDRLRVDVLTLGSVSVD